MKNLVVVRENAEDSESRQILCVTQKSAIRWPEKQVKRDAEKISTVLSQVVTEVPGRAQKTPAGLPGVPERTTSGVANGKRSEVDATC